eukprot:scaffold306_cov525-Prasinococcus_capsulatus_cf.AAC.69
MAGHGSDEPRVNSSCRYDHSHRRGRSRRSPCTRDDTMDAAGRRCSLEISQSGHCARHERIGSPQPSHTECKRASTYSCRHRNAPA